jgi:hypothetical protein
MHAEAASEYSDLVNASTNSYARAVSKIVESSLKMLPAMTDATDYLRSLQANAKQDGMTAWAGQLGRAIDMAPQAKDVPQYVNMLSIRGL